MLLPLLKEQMSLKTLWNPRKYRQKRKKKLKETKLSGMDSFHMRSVAHLMNTSTSQNWRHQFASMWSLKSQRTLLSPLNKCQSSTPTWSSSMCYKRGLAQLSRTQMTSTIDMRPAMTMDSWSTSLRDEKLTKSSRWRMSAITSTTRLSCALCSVGKSPMSDSLKLTLMECTTIALTILRNPKLRRIWLVRIFTSGSKSTRLNVTPYA